MAISLTDHENRIKSFEAKLPDIENRINSIIASAKDHTIVTLSRNSGFVFDSKYTNYNYVVCGISASISRGEIFVTSTNGKVTQPTGTVEWRVSKSGSNSFSVSVSGNIVVVHNITVLFYK